MLGVKAPETLPMEERLEKLKEIARTLRQDVIRMIHLAGDGHPGLLYRWPILLPLCTSR